MFIVTYNSFGGSQGLMQALKVWEFDSEADAKVFAEIGNQHFAKNGRYDEFLLVQGEAEHVTGSLQDCWERYVQANFDEEDW